MHNWLYASLLDSVLFKETKIIFVGDLYHVLAWYTFILCAQIQKMNIIFYLIIISLIVAGGFLAAFFWAVSNGQYDDDYTPGVRILLDDDMIEKQDKTN